ncbi:hypothetical protein Tco_1441105, partial [Tanacetum coccineum]
MLAGRHVGLRDSFASVEETGKIDPFLPSKVSHDLLSNLPHSEVQMRLDGLTFDELVDFHDVSALRFVMSNNILNMEARVLSGDVARLRNEVVSLRNQQADSAILISSLEVKLRDAE